MEASLHLPSHWSLRSPWPQARADPGETPTARMRLQHAAKQERSAVGRMRRRMRAARVPRSLERAGHLGAWRARGPALPLAAAGPCGGPREQPAHGLKGQARRRTAGLGEGGGGKGVKAEEGVPGNRLHMPGLLPCSWRRVGPPGGPPVSLATKAADGKTFREGSVPAQPPPLQGCGTLGPGEPGRGSGQQYTDAENQRPALQARLHPLAAL